MALKWFAVIDALAVACYVPLLSSSVFLLALICLGGGAIGIIFGAIGRWLLLLLFYRVLCLLAILAMIGWTSYLAGAHTLCIFIGILRGVHGLAPFAMLVPFLVFSGPRNGLD
jgi:hypothetical protein